MSETLEQQAGSANGALVERVGAEQLRRVHAAMVRIRSFERAFQELFRELRRASARQSGNRLSAFEYGNPSGGPELQGNLELAIGQESIAAAVVQLRDTDYLAGTHRAHHTALSKGVELRPLVAEMFGRRTGLSGGRAGDFNLHDVAHSFESSPVIGQLLPVAVGHGLAAQLQRRDDVAMVVIGDGAANQGTFHEAANLAGLWKLPVVFVIENNGYALSVPVARACATEHLYRRAEGYGFPGALVVDNDPVALYETAARAIARARAGDGPSLIEVRTDRLAGGFEGDRQAYRPEGELDALNARDVVPRFEQALVDAGVLDQARVAELWAAEAEAVQDAIEFARSSPWPQPDDAFRRVFAEAGR